VKVLAVSGSLRRASHNTALLRAAGEVAPEGVDLVLWDGLDELPLYDQDRDAGDVPAQVARLREDWGAADAILFATPEYNGSVPGGLKNAIDWASRPRFEAPLTNKTVAVISASEGQFGGMWAQADLRKILGIAGARVVGDELPVPHVHDKLDSESGLLDEELLERLRLVLENLVREAAPVPVAA
jgi:chromate reductase